MNTETRVGLFIIVSIGIFFYLSINIGSIRLDRDQYYSYKAYFDDTGGLDVKASVKIAGVEVGWVDSITLLEGGKAEVNIMINKRNRLARNAYAIIQQEGLIGQKTLEIDPGDPSAGLLTPGSILSMPGKSPASVGDLLDQFRDIANSIHDIANSFRNVFASRQGEENMRKAIEGVARASDRLADFSETLERTVKKNEDNINGMLIDFRKVSAHLDKGVPIITDDFHNIHNSLTDDVFPELKGSFENIKLAFADDRIPKLTNKIGNMSDTASSAFENIEDAAGHAKDGFREAGQVMNKLNTGKGVLGKLINEDETYSDIKKTIRGFKNFVSKTDSLKIIIDAHSETLLQTGDTKGYFEVKLRPTSTYFYQLQMVASPRGAITRHKTFYEYFDENEEKLNVDELIKDGRDLIRFPGRVDRIEQTEDSILFGAQFGMRFNRLALRVGLFESTAGAAVDWYVPLNTSKLHWITTFEAFDFDGVYRIGDVRAHLKWINRLYFMRNVYTTFGIDDFYSRRDATFFFGGGLRFGDDNLKYFLSMLPFGKR